MSFVCVDLKPKLSELLKLHTLLPELEPSVLYRIGVALQLGDEDGGQWLDALLEQDSNKNQLFEVLKKWLQDSKSATWKGLINVLESHIDKDAQALVEKVSKGSLARILGC
jgi:hypothetical protein